MTGAANLSSRIIAFFVDAASSKKRRVPIFSQPLICSRLAIHTEVDPGFPGVEKGVEPRNL
jgi:hypothetical protein